MARWLLGLILVAYFLVAAMYSLGTPPWEAPDEPSHYLYAEYLALHGSLPPEAPPQRGHYWQNGYVTSLYEWYHPPLYYALVAPSIALVNLLRPGAIPQTFPPVDPAFPGQARNLFAVLPDPDFAAPGLRLARWFTVALGLGTLCVVYRAAMLASKGDRAVALTATGMMAFVPQYTFLSGYVTNDSLAILLSALCLLACLYLLQISDGCGMWWVAGAGALLALALYTKWSLLFLAPLCLFSLLTRVMRHRSIRRWLLESSILASVAILPFLLGLLFVPGLWDRVVYTYASLQPKPELVSLEYLTSLWPETVTSFWGRFGWANVSTPRWIAHVLNATSLVGLLGSLLLLVRRWQAPRSPFLRQMLVLLWTVCGLALIGFLRFNLSVRQPQGRLLFTALPALAILVALGYRRLAGRHFPLVGSGVVLFTFVANLVCLFGTLLPAYAPAI